MKNTLATVQSIARQSAKGAVSMAAFRASFEARLISLSSTHNILTRASWEQANLRDLLRQELAPHAAEAVSLEGDDIHLGSRHTLALGMIFHELATNAVKYGALSTAAGHVKVSWRVEADRLVITWRETGGPPVAVPTRRGFGSTLIERLAGGDLEGRAELAYGKAGLTCVIDMPMADQPADPPPTPR